MELEFWDILIFLSFILVVVLTSMYKSRKEETGEDFFLASRGLVWPLIGISLIAANISTEQFVGMSGQSASSVGIAIASYEWIAAITLIFVAFFFLPKFLSSGIYTIPEFLEYRYNSTARTIMAIYTMIIYVGVTISAVLYSGGITIYTIFGIDLTSSIWIVGAIAALYATWGGLKAVAWADLFQGSALIIGGAVVLYFGFEAIGGVDNFFTYNEDKLHMVLPADNEVLPWTALVIGLWIPNIYYWGLNQYITQRTLAAKSLKEGQLGIIFAAGLKILIPFVIVFPGIMAAQLYGDSMNNTDAAYPLLIRNLIPLGLRGFMLAAIAGAVMSSLASMLNSASTIFTMDLYKKYLSQNPAQPKLILVGRLTTILFVIIGCIIAPQLGHPKLKGIFTYIQEFQGYISPGILAAFVFGFLVKKAPPIAGVAALILCPIVYGLLQLFYGEIAFLNRMAITFVIILFTMSLITIFKPLKTPVVLPQRKDFDMKPTPKVLWLGMIIIIITVFLYIIFW
ncbi:MAG: solute:sodium symporter family transporter [Ignavibacteria bacterium]|jgi:SSS family solute:Na+ symporter